MKYLIYILSTLILCISACNETANDPSNGLFKVTGYVYHQNVPISNVTVSIDEKFNYTVQTDDGGYFSIVDVDKGDHQLKIYKSFPQNGEAFSERTFDIDVRDDVTLDNLKLPKAVQLHEPIIIRLDSIQIAWSPSDIEDFREYKIYRHTSSGLDETTGTLIHVSTSINDTTYLDTDIIEPGDYFYRVYVMNEYGRLGGSNIESYNLAYSVLTVTINYTGNFTINNIYRVYLGVSNFPGELQDDGILTENNTSLEIIIDDPNSFHFYLHSTKIDDYTFGPYFIGAFLDITGSHSGSSTIPSGCPAIIYDGVNPFDSMSNFNATPIAVSRGDTTEITVTYDDSFISP